MKEEPLVGQGAAENLEPSGRVREVKAGTNPRKELVREQLIDIAADLFATKGYAQTGINDIASAIGLGRSAVYHYFRNKEEILAALVESEALTPSHQLQELMAVPGLTATDRLRRAIIAGIVRRLSSGSRFIVVSRLEMQIPEELGPLYKQGRRQIYDFYVRCIQDGIDRGEFRPTDAKLTAFAVIGMANWTSRWYNPEGVRSPSEIGEVIADFAIHGLLADKSERTIDIDTARASLGEIQSHLTALDKLLK